MRRGALDSTVCCEGPPAAPVVAARADRARVDELCVEQALHVEDLGHPVTGAGVEGSAQAFAVLRRQFGLAGLDPLGVEAHQGVDRVHRQGHGTGAVQDDGAGLGRGRRFLAAQQRSRAGQRQHRAAQVGQPQQALRTQRRLGDGGQADHFGNLVGG